MAKIPHIPPDERIYAHLLPLGEGLRLQLLVRPLPNGAWLPPARGSEIIHGEHDNQTVQTRRDLQGEQRKIQQVLNVCPLLAQTEPDNTEWQFTDTQDALEALTQLRSTDRQLLECVWPEGERLRIGGRRNMQSLSLNIQRQGEWFALSGEIALDDGRVLQLRQRLQQIVLLAGKGDGKSLTLNALALPFMKTLADEAGHVVGDDDWQRQMRELEAREKHLPVIPSTLKAELRDYQQEGFCCHPSLVLDDVSLASSKLSACLAIIHELRGNNHKALVFSQFVDHLSLLRNELDKLGISFQYLDGSISPMERKKRVDAFQSGDGDLFLISLKAGGAGLNLTAADYVIHLDPWWNPAVEDQASDRAHRMGQERPVTVYRLVMEGTIEEQMVALHSRKRQLAEDLLEGSDSVGRMDTAALLSVLRG